jgi:hypothetical protein
MDKPVLYRPQKFNSKAVDGIIVLIKLNDEESAKKTRKNVEEKKKEKKKLLMFPLRITLALATHANSCGQFFEEYGRWITNLSRFDVEVQFLWMTPECRKSQEYPAEPQQQWPKHLERYIPLEDANKGIWEEYANAQKRLLERQSCYRRHKLTRRRLRWEFCRDWLIERRLWWWLQTGYR